MIEKILGNAQIIFGLVFITLVVLDWYNPYMGFLSNRISICLLVTFCVIAVCNGARNSLKG